MSHKAAPIGFRVGVGNPWGLPQQIFNYHNDLLYQLTLYFWLQNFSQQNRFYFLRYSHFQLSNVLVLLVFIPFRTRRRRKFNAVSLLTDPYRVRKRKRRKKNMLKKVDSKKITKYFRFIRMLRSQFSKNPLLCYRLYVRKIGRVVLSKYLKSKTTKKHVYIKKAIQKKGPSLFWRFIYFSRIIKRNKARRRFLKKRNKKLKIFRVFKKLRKKNKLKRIIKNVYRARWKHSWLKQRKSRYKKNINYYKSKYSSSSSYSQKKARGRRNDNVQLFHVTSARRRYLKLFHLKIRYFRFRFYLENYLSQMYNKRLDLVLENFNDIIFNGFFNRDSYQRTLIPRLLTAAHFFCFKTHEYKRYNFLKTLAHLALGGSLTRAPHVLLQWVWMVAHRVKKHSLFLTHRRLFSLFVQAIRNIMFLIGVFNGLRFELVGKINDSTRTRRQILFYGKTFKRQTLITNFVYAFKNLPTYIGVLGCRLWLVY